MEQSLLYNLLSFGIIDKWRKAEDAENARFKKREQELAEQLKEELTEKGKDLLTCYYLEIENRADDLFYNVGIKILNLGIQIGMQLNQAFQEFEQA